MTFGGKGYNGAGADECSGTVEVVNLLLILTFMLNFYVLTRIVANLCPFRASTLNV